MESLAPAYWQDCASQPLPEATIGDALRTAAARWPSRTALIDGGEGDNPRKWTFASLLESSEKVARGLLQLFRPGEHIAIWAANCPEWICVEFGAALAGLTLVTVNPAYRASEVEYVLRQSRAAGVIVMPEYRDRDLLQVVEEVRPGLEELREVLSLGGWEALLASGDAQTALPSVTPGDIAQIQYTSGTTGFPKGALLTHRGLTANGRLYAQVIGATENDTWINPMPLFHTAGCGLVTLGALQTGGAQVLPPAFEPATILELFATHNGSVLLGVPTMLVRLLDEAGKDHREYPSWRLVSLGGAPVPPELVRRAQEQFGVGVAVGYGQTEASPYLTHTVPDDPNPDWASTVGKPLPHIEVRICDPSTGEIAPFGTVGEICTRSACVMQGYFDNPDATAEAIDGEGWLHTGDLGSMNTDGYLRIQGRLKEMIIRGGENIFPREIEDVLYGHPAVASVAVFGLPDPLWGEIVAACVQLRAGNTASEQELIAFCRDRLSSFKVPRVWEYVEEFPQTPSGKIQKFALRDRLLLREERGDGAALQSPV